MFYLRHWLTVYEKQGESERTMLPTFHDMAPTKLVNFPLHRTNQANPIFFLF